MNPSELLQQLRSRYPSAAALARSLNMTRQAAGMLLQGARQPGDATIIRAARLLGLDPGPVLCSAAAARADDPATAATWAALAQKLADQPQNPYPAPRNEPANPINNTPEPLEPPTDIPKECGDFYYVKLWSGHKSLGVWHHEEIRTG